ncbi:MAG: hypothetical protein M3Y58_06630 [Chloroflexota bacterium]|nr:hypothetical protein [Chloroflexota bacterium]
MASGRRKRVMIGIVAAIVALLTVATTVFASGFGGRHGFAAPTGNNQPSNNQMGNNNRGFGPRAIVTAADTTKHTITLGGLPQQIATVTINQNVKLVAIQPDGTTKDAAIGDFTTGSLVEVHFQFNGRGGRGRGNGQPGMTPNQPGNGPTQPGTTPNQPSNGQGQPNVTVTELALVPAGQVRVEGLVTATGNTLTIVDGGGLQLTITPSGSAKVTKGTATASGTDIKVGDRITVSGTQNGAGVNADTIRIFDPSAMRSGMRPGMKPGSGNQPAPATT